MLIDEKGWLRVDAGGVRVVHVPTVRTSPMAAGGPFGVVWHATGGVGGPGAAEGLARRIQTYRRAIDRPVSWHFLISREEGVVYQSAPVCAGTWHVGRPGVVAGRWFGNVNAATVGVELENAGPLVEVDGRFYAWPWWRPGGDHRPDGRYEVAGDRATRRGAWYHDRFSEDQVKAAGALVRAIAARFQLGASVLRYGHVDFAAPRKTDPGPVWMEEVLPGMLDGIEGQAGPATVTTPEPEPLMAAGRG